MIHLKNTPLIIWRGRRSSDGVGGFLHNMCVEGWRDEAAQDLAATDKTHVVIYQVNLIKFRLLELHFRANEHI